jgi:Zn-dependent protease with chaperone function
LRGVPRRFWGLCGLVCLIEAILLLLAVRAISDDVHCWIVIPGQRARLGAVCGTSIGLVGHDAWIPVVVVLALVGSSLLAGIATALHQVVKTRHVVRRLLAVGSSSARSAAVSSSLNVSVTLVPEERFLCFCTGLLRPRVVVSEGALSRLTDEELKAVVAHEASHARRRDPARAIAVRAAANALYFLPVARELSRSSLMAAELGADAHAVVTVGRRPLVSALIRALEEPQPILASAPGMASLDALELRIETLHTAQLPKWRPSAARVAMSSAALLCLCALSLWLPRGAVRVVPVPVQHVKVDVRQR